MILTKKIFKTMVKIIIVIINKIIKMKKPIIK